MKLKPKHLLMVDLLADPLDSRTYTEKAAEAGFSERHIYTLLRDEDFLKELHKRTTVLVASMRANVYRHLLRNSKTGDTAASVAFLKGCGDIQGGTNVITNVNQTNSEGSLSDRIEAIQKKREAELSGRVVFEDT